MVAQTAASVAVAAGAAVLCSRQVSSYVASDEYLRWQGAKRLFHEIDKNGDGMVAREELETELRRLGASSYGTRFVIEHAIANGIERWGPRDFIRTVAPALDHLLVIKMVKGMVMAIMARLRVSVGHGENEGE